jgi:hypothetical protein
MPGEIDAQEACAPGDEKGCWHDRVSPYSTSA